MDSINPIGDINDSLSPMNQEKRELEQVLALVYSTIQANPNYTAIESLRAHRDRLLSVLATHNRQIAFLEGWQTSITNFLQ